MDFAYQNGCDALALTDHGHANGMSYQVLHAKKMKQEGKEFKPIFGVEAYFLDSVEEWKELKDRAAELEGLPKELKELKKATGALEAQLKGVLSPKSHLQS